MLEISPLHLPFELMKFTASPLDPLNRAYKTINSIDARPNYRSHSLRRLILLARYLGISTRVAGGLKEVFKLKTFPLLPWRFAEICYAFLEAISFSIYSVATPINLFFNVNELTVLKITKIKLQRYHMNLFL